jgi:hypothetical protein
MVMLTNGTHPRATRFLPIVMQGLSNNLLPQQSSAAADRLRRGMLRGCARSA